MTDPRDALDPATAGSSAPAEAAESAGLAEGAQRAGSLDVLVAYVPTTATETVLAAVFQAGAGAIGDYRECAWVVTGRGQFRPLVGAAPAVGEVGRLERVAEDRIEVVLSRRLRLEVIAALRAAHPYEEPAFHVIAAADLG